MGTDIYVVAFLDDEEWEKDNRGNFRKLLNSYS